tara:strand:- start:6725 stop:9073 length:2349 start_codon:yes stop_codon:yes gene_type:complete
MSLLFDASARAADLSEKRRKKEKGSWWKDVLKQTVVTGIASPIAETISEGISGVISKPFDNNERLWQETAQKATESNIAANNRLTSTMATYNKGKDNGLTDREVAGEALRPQITRQLEKDLAEGKFVQEGNEVSLLNMPNNSQAFNVVVDNLIEEKLSENDDAHFKSYMKLINLGQSRITENSTQRRARLSSFNRRSSNWLGSVTNFVLGKSGKELDDKALSLLKDSSKYKHGIAIQAAYKDYETTRGVEEGEKLFGQIAAQDHINRVDASNFKSFSRIQGQKFKYNEGGVLVSQNVITVIETDSRTKKIITNSINVGQPQETNVGREVFNTKNNSTKANLLSLRSGGPDWLDSNKAKKFYKELKDSYPDVPIDDLSALYGTKEFLGEDGQKRLDNIADNLKEKTNGFMYNEKNAANSLAVNQQKQRKILLEGEAAFEAKVLSQHVDYQYILANGTPEEIIKAQEEMIPVLEAAHERRSELGEIKAGLDANVIALDRLGNPIAVGNFLNDKNQSVVDPQYGFTPLEHEISNAKFDEWKRAGRSLSEETIADITSTFETVNNPAINVNTNGEGKEIAEEVISTDTVTPSLLEDPDAKTKVEVDIVSAPTEIGIETEKRDRAYAEENNLAYQADTLSEEERGGLNPRNQKELLDDKKRERQEKSIKNGLANGWKGLTSWLGAKSNLSTLRKETRALATDEWNNSSSEEKVAFANEGINSRFQLQKNRIESMEAEQEKTATDFKRASKEQLKSIEAAWHRMTPEERYAYDFYISKYVEEQLVAGS